MKVLRGLARENSTLTQLEAALEKAPSSLRLRMAALQEAAEQAGKIAASLADAGEEFREWAAALRKNCQEHLEDILFLAPWLGLPVSAENGVPQDMLAQLERVPTLLEVSKFGQSVCPALEGALRNLAADSSPARQETEQQLKELARNARLAGEHASQRLLDLETLARQSEELAAMDFTFLFDSERDLFSIGFNVTEGRRDASFYDLLASEARLCSYVAIASGQVPQDHWFSLGRLLVASPHGPILVSWSGSMFEYLMPLLVMPHYENTLLDHTCRAAVQRQIDYGKNCGVPWGISESGYNRTDVALNYQYRAFGVPGLGLKRGLAEDLVISPYASVMALLVAPRAACENLQRLAREGRQGAYGFYEAVDYTSSRLPPDEASAVIRSFMAHHQGMSLLALDNLLRRQPDAAPFPGLPVAESRRPALARASAEGGGQRLSGDLELENRAPFLGRNGKRHAGFHQSVARRAGGPSVVQRPLPCRGQQRRRRLQPLARPGRHPLARGRHPRLLGDVRLSARRGDRQFWSAAYQPTLRARPKATRPSSPRPAPSSASAMPSSRSTPKSACRPKTTSSCAASRSPTAPPSRASSN